MSTSGKVAQKPAAKPAGNSAGAHSSTPGGNGPACRLTSRPRRRTTPVFSTSASAVNCSIPTRSRIPTESSADAKLGPIIAEATAEVVADGAARVRICTCNPCSARHTPVVSPITPAPSTMTSGRPSPIPSDSSHRTPRRHDRKWQRNRWGCGQPMSRRRKPRIPAAVNAIAMTSRIARGMISSSAPGSLGTSANGEMRSTLSGSCRIGPS